MSFDEVIQDIIRSFHEGKVVLFCGAGISANSGIPMVGEFMRNIFNSLSVSEPEMRLIQEATLPFESFMSILQENSNIDDLLDIFSVGEPTFHHKFIAELMISGKVKFVVTTNFDSLIESALLDKGWSENENYCVFYQEDDYEKIDWENGKPALIKIHGSLHDKSSMAITIQQVAGKIYSGSRKQIINNVFNSENYEFVLISGYSCSDVFDISPYIEMISENHNKVVLVNHKPSESSIEDIYLQTTKNPFKKFQNSFRINYSTDALMNELWQAVLEIPKIESNIRRNDSWQENINKWHSNNVSEAAGELIIGRILMDIDKYDDASRHFKRAINAAQVDKDRKREAFALSLLGNITDTDSVEMLNRALLISKEINDRNLQANCLCNLISSYFGEQQVDKAIECGNEGLKIAEEIGDRSREARLYGNLGGLYGSIGQLDSAISHFTKGYQISKEIGDKAEEGSALINIATAYDNKGLYGYAEKYYKKSRKVFLPYLGEDHRVIKEIDDRLDRLATKPRIIRFSDLFDDDD